MSEITQFPRQVMSYRSKGKAWRKSMLDWASSQTFLNCSPVRKSVQRMKLNYDLINGVLHMDDLTQLIDPGQRGFLIPKSIQHFPIMNSKLRVLQGEESRRSFEYRFVVTNPTSISEMENTKKQVILQRLQQIVEQSQDEQSAQAATEKLQYYSAYEYQDLREMRVNALANHYSKEYDFRTLFNSGFVDAYTVGEEIYQTDIVGGEPVIERVNPTKLRAYMAGDSNRIEDADVIIIEDYWSPGRIIDTYYDVLTQKDINYIENLPNMPGNEVNGEGNLDERVGIQIMKNDLLSSTDLFSVESNFSTSLAPYDFLGNIRVIKMYWKSKRKIKQVKSYDPMTGEEVFNFYDENYILNEDMGEEEQIFWINEAWEGVKIGESVYVNIRPRVVQYNSISNPSKCHFGIIGSIYNVGDQKAYSLVDMMKPFNYLYDVIHDRLNKTMARNWGKILEMDLGLIPQGWKVDKWMYYAQVNGIAFKDSRNVINEGPATGKLVGNLNNASKGVLDADWGNNIQQYINLLEYIKGEMGEVVGISKQREGQISNRETVGGIERATLQSSHITEWLFLTHDNLKKRALEAFIETAKIASKGGSIKFQHILPDSSTMVMEIDGDEFAESDYGIVVDNSDSTQKLSQQIDQIAQFALQSQRVSLSSVLKMYTTASLSEKMRMLEFDERRMQEQAAQQQEKQIQAQQEAAQLQAQQEQAKMQQEYQMNVENNETKVLVANIQAQARVQDDFNGKSDGIAEPMSESDKAKLEESIRQFNEKLSLDREKFNNDKKVNQEKLELERRKVSQSKTKQS